MSSSSLSVVTLSGDQNRVDAYRMHLHTFDSDDTFKQCVSQGDIGLVYCLMRTNDPERLLEAIRETFPCHLQLLEFIAWAKRHELVDSVDFQTFQHVRKLLFPGLCDAWFLPSGLQSVTLVNESSHASMEFKLDDEASLGKIVYYATARVRPQPASREWTRESPVDEAIEWIRSQDESHPLLVVPQRKSISLSQSE